MKQIPTFLLATGALMIFVGADRVLAQAKPTPPSIGSLRPKEAPCLAPTASDEKGWGKKAYFWKKKEVAFNFMPGEGTDKLKARVEKEALKWNGIANITLKRIADTEKSDIRVGFAALGHWSKIGNTALDVAEKNRTMNLQITESSGGEDVRRVTLHEFGHALGLMHEHQHPDVTIKWKEDAVYKYYGGAPNYWNEAQVKTNVLSHYSHEGTESSGFDPKSIMLYPIPASITENFSSVRNTKQSDKDREFLRKAYP